jgi:hypothetical protein
MVGKAARAGNTEKISISLDRADLTILRRRARKLYAGNLSAAVAEGALRIREQEGREQLVQWLGRAGETSAAERNALRAEWHGEVTAPRAKRRR